MGSTTRYFGLLVLANAITSVSAAQNCQASYTICQPSGATASSVPGAGPDLAPMYNDLLDTVKGISAPSKRGDSDNMLEARDSPSICCFDGGNCLNLNGFNVPMCYDRFTTNYVLADGATGNIVSGDFTAAQGKGIANLRNGTYLSADDSTGNMYTSGGAASYSPTNTAAIPTPYTASGVGSAIPITALGVLATFVVTLPGTTDPGTTFAGETAPSTVAGTTRAGTTVAAHTTLVTSLVPGAAVSTSSSKADGAVRAMPTGPVIGAFGAAAAAFLL